LCDLARQHPDCRASHVVAPSLASPHRRGSDIACLLRTMGTLWVHGVDSAPEGLFVHERRRRVRLPPYPFERESYWIGPPDHREPVGGADRGPGPAALAHWFYRPAWVPAAPTDPSVEAK